MSKNLFWRVRQWWQGRTLAHHLRYGVLGERRARRHLKRLGLKFLTANLRSARGEIDLVMRDKDCPVFIEVKTRSSADWGRPADAVDQECRRRLTRARLDYLRLPKNPAIKTRYDIVEVLVHGQSVREIRHLPNAFAMERPYRYG